MQKIVTDEIAKALGKEKVILKRWAEAPKKGATAAQLLRNRYITLEEYMAIPDGRNHFWNNPEMIDLYYHYGLNINGVCFAIGVSNALMRDYVIYGSNDRIAKKLEQLRASYGKA